MAGAGRGAGGLPAMDEAAEAERVGVGSKRARDPPDAKDSYGFVGDIAGEKKPHSNGIFLKKAENVPVLPNIDGTSKIGGLYMHGIHGSESSPGSNALSSHHGFGSSSPGGYLKNNTRKPTKICTFYAQGRCKRGKSCTFLHEGEFFGSYNQESKEGKAGLLAPVGYGNHRGTEEGSQIQHLSNLKEPQFRSSAGSSQDELYRTLVHAYGEHSRGLTIDEHNSHMLRASHGLKIDDSLTTKPPGTKMSCLDDRGDFSRLHLDGGKRQFDVVKRDNPRDSHLSRSYLEVNPLKGSDYHYQPFDSSVSFGPHQYSKKSSAYGGADDSCDYSLVNLSLPATHHPGTLPLHNLTPGNDFSHHKDVDFNKGDSSRPMLRVSSSPQPVVESVGQLSPIKEDVWITSVPFVPSFNFPGSTSPSKRQHDPLVDGINPHNVESLNNLKSSNISCRISSQYGDKNVIREGIPEKALACHDKLARNISAKGSNAFASLVSYDRKQSFSLDGDNRAKTRERKNDATLGNEKARDFRFHLVEHVKELVKPIWKEGNLSKDAHKLIVKKSVDKVFASLDEIPDTEEAIRKYITTSGSKIEKLVMAYVDRHRTS
ncbi:hypothetical protein GUJ93_ZPchr0005g15080 [Zizania palustris]|uniref:C3H1-type domain-containing protein n=1 Tax=Zizania palustris TaxID=103762 RepID=A0A8J5VEX6_ZIZPA|nr:hypothetical protein GUJ93_ZPchr0005g15080 [Zizania palustris]